MQKIPDVAVSLSLTFLLSFPPPAKIQFFAQLGFPLENLTKISFFYLYKRGYCFSASDSVFV